ncbi:MAG: hypothetical protein IPP32_11170 [Bacteroidetes bacterium]|nr:hypothetical protein [Bacteroidota bacterium]
MLNFNWIKKVSGMKKFSLQVLLFSALLALSILAVFAVADGKSDEFYVRFSSPKQQSLILGASRAAQGMKPAVLNEIFKANGINTHLFNYSFTLAHSPYGPTYLESIKKKIDVNAKNGIFIVTLDPWCISNAKSKNPNDALNFPEIENPVGKTMYVNAKPNIPYLIQSYNYPYFCILKNKIIRPESIVDNDGWLDVEIPMDSAIVAKRLEAKVIDYNKNALPYFTFSILRYNYLRKTIQFLQTHGTVYLLRIPAQEKMIAIEDQYMPNFDGLMHLLAKSEKVSYLNYKDTASYQYTDGNHLYKTSAVQFSKSVAQQIVKDLHN